MNPADAFWGWFHDLPASQRTHVIQSVMLALPGYSLRGVLDEAQCAREFFKLFSPNKDQVFKEAAKLLTLRTFIDYFIMRNRKTREDWERRREVLIHIRDREPGNAGYFDEKLEQLPFTSAQWLRTSEAWLRIRANELTDSAIRAWEDQLLIESRRSGMPTHTKGEEEGP